MSQLVAKDRHVTVLVGTTKGAFILSPPDAEGPWNVSGPHCDGWTINHVVGDAETGHIWAGGGGDWNGAGVWRSEDGGATWELSKLSGGEFDEWAKNDPEMAEMFGWEPRDMPFDGEMSAVWSLHRAHDALYAGTKPAQLLKSTDNGKSWERLDGLSNHPSRESWNPGGAGLILHTIVTDPGTPEKLWTGISSAGVFASEDGGETWDRRNRLSNAEACGHHDHPAAPKDGETGHCVHNMVRAGEKGVDLLYQQNHHGVWRSSDGGRTWTGANEGLPSTFGFPICVHPRDAKTIWVLPLNGDSSGRYPPDAKAAVWKSTDGGESWADKREGLPGANCFFTVLRQAMATDATDPVGIYFGTNTGSIFASFDEGESWSEIARHLPTVLGVEVMQSA